MNSIYIRKSKGANKNTYAVFFYIGIGPTAKCIGSYQTPNGSVVDLGKVIHNYLHFDSVPVGMIRKTLHPAIEAVGDC